jgi:hypothetical protein
MTERDFCYWLQGLFEISDPKTLDEDQVSMIKEHLQLVFNKVTKSSLDICDELSCRNHESEYKHIAIDLENIPLNVSYCGQQASC